MIGWMGADFINTELSHSALVFQALQHGFFDFETFDVDEYEHYEVKASQY